MLHHKGLIITFIGITDQAEVTTSISWLSNADQPKCIAALFAR